MRLDILKGKFLIYQVLWIVSQNKAYKLIILLTCDVIDPILDPNEVSANFSDLMESPHIIIN